MRRLARYWSNRRGSAVDEKPDASSSNEGQVSRAQRLLDSGIFDVEYYSASVGHSFDSDLQAAGHCIRQGMPRSQSPNPLLSIASVPPDVQRAWRTKQLLVVLKYLRSARARKIPLSPLFDSGQAPGTDADKESHPGGALGAFLEVANGQTRLPVPIDFPDPAPTLDTARRVLTERAAATRTQGSLTGPRTVDEWDQAAEQRWKSRWVQAPLPHGSGPLVSVILPVRNRPQLIRAALESIQAQTLDGWEVIVVDDGSTDETPNVVAECAAHDPRITLLRCEHGGVSAARNRGLSAARGNYVAFLDSDNTWRSDYLRLAIAALHGQGVQAAHAVARLIDKAANGDVYRAHDGGLDDLLVKNHIDLNTLVVATDVARAAGGFDEALRRWVDHDFAIRVARLTRIQLLPFIACDYANDAEAPDRITTTESEAWQFVALGKNWVDWDALEASVHERREDLVSVIIPTYQDWRLTVDATRAVLESVTEDGQELEVVIVDNGSHREVGSQVVAEFITEPRVVYRRLPRNLNFATGCNYGFFLSRGASVVFLNNDTLVRRDWLQSLLPHLEDEKVRGVQPLLLYPDDTIQTAGTVFGGGDLLPGHHLVGHPPEDAERLADRRFSAVTAAALAMRATDFATLRGFDPIFINGWEDVDLCLRATSLLGGHFVMEPGSKVTHLESQTPGRGAMIGPNRTTFIQRWRGKLPVADIDRYDALGLQLAHLRRDDGNVPAVASPVVVRATPTYVDEHPSFRWGIKLPSIPGPRGDVWGDTYLVASLSTALRRLCQEVVTYRHGAHNSPASHLDDVVLGIRGLDVIHPQPGKVNLLWIISHPEDVDPGELRGFDVVYAASTTWAEELGRRAGRPVYPLLQAVDTQLLPAPGKPLGPGTSPVFVGSHHKRIRQTVLDAVAADVGVVVNGADWEGTLVAPHVASSHVPNIELTTLYRSHGLVLADHWPDMAAHGFIANRVFDAVASGARVVSDAVPGIEDVFGGAVRVYRSVDHLKELCSPEGRSLFASDEEMIEIARRTTEEHSFDRRAQTLLDAVLANRATPHPVSLPG